MKKFLTIFVLLALCFSLIFTFVACKDQGGDNSKPNDFTRPSNAYIDNSFKPTGKTLVAYFSKTNTTKGVADAIQKYTDADIFEIERKEPYPDSYTPTTEEAKEEKERNARPELAVYLPDEVIAQYDTIILGFPIWWHTAPMPVLSFLNYYDLSGKTIYTFCTSGGSSINESTADIRINAKGATVVEGKRFSGGSDSGIQTWVEALNLNTTPATPDTNNPPQNNNPDEEDSNTLVVYFSMPETSNPNNMTTEEANSTVIIDGEVLGNTQYMAYVIQETLRADIFRIVPKIPYPTDHRTLVDLASKEKAANARPEIKDSIKDLEKYDNIFIGYPNWWGDMPMIMYTFFETYDFSGKTIIPFNTHGGSGFSNTISTIRSLEPNAQVKNGLSISRNHIQDAYDEIKTWVLALNLNKSI